MCQGIDADAADHLLNWLAGAWIFIYTVSVDVCAVLCQIEVPKIVMLLPREKSLILVLYIFFVQVIELLLFCWFVEYAIRAGTESVLGKASGISRHLP